MGQNDKVLYSMRYLTAGLIILGAIMHLIGLIIAFDGSSLPWGGLPHLSVLVRVLLCLFYLFAIVMYPVSAVMVLKGVRWAYWLIAVAPSVGGLLIVLGFICPDSGLLMFLAGNFDKEITPVAFFQVITESIAVAYAAVLIRYKAW